MKYLISSTIKFLSLAFCALAIAAATLVFTSIPVSAASQVVEAGVDANPLAFLPAALTSAQLPVMLAETAKSEEQEKGLTGRTRDEFFEGLGNKGISDRTREDFLEEDLGDNAVTGRPSVQELPPANARWESGEPVPLKP
ncbi:MAG: hypothetical protein ACFB8W_05235 [Elainellaceae cyanobacterium]